ncbi:4-hydroxy-2-oxoheptanedioate aldolase [Paenalcaligenes sp. Me52]|uniref:4-hydroxy-2-oxoheptanedioate aldolase n=1 Tax=Paenalcaligenes sp. Me52 TaxID=3392038 RepID=UPI003D2CEA68
MDLPVNTFKQRLRTEQQVGVWVGLPNSTAAEIAATAGFDWLVLDGEHAPNDVRSLLPLLQAVAPYDSHPVIRPPVGDVALIKQMLDIGVQTLLVPMVDTPEQATLMAQAMRYPPQGIRGVGAALARASRWNAIENYAELANDQMCLLVQVESLEGLKNIEAIAAVEGVDGIFIGPADLSAAMGHLGNPGHPDVQEAIDTAIARIKGAGKAAGILSVSEEYAQHYLDLGCEFVAVGLDTSVLASGLRSMAARYKGGAAVTKTASGPGY